MDSQSPRLLPVGRLRPLVLAGFAVATLAIVTLGVSGVLNLRDIESDAAWVTHTYDVMAGLADVLSASVDIGTGARGYVNTADPAQLGLHDRGVANAEAAIERLRQQTSDDPSQEAEIAEVRELLGQRTQLLDSLIAESRTNQEQARLDVRWIQTTPLTEQLRRALDGLQKHQRDLLEARRVRLAHRALILSLIIGGGCGLLLAFLLATLAAATRHEQERETLLSYQAELMGVVGHDLRGPLSAIMMSVSLLAAERELPAPKRLNLSRRALASARRMERIIRDLLDFTRDRVGEGISIDVAPMDLGELSRKIAAELRLEHPSATIGLECSGNLRGTWDADRITQVIYNLATNAIKYGDEGNAITVRARDLESEVVLEVHNFGDGIPAHLQPHLFEPFQRGQPPARHSSHGRVGLGLHIVRTLVQAHGGSVTVQSANRETTFTIKLPRPPAAATT